MAWTLYEGDCLEVMKTLPSESVDAVITDPPYELGFMGKKWDNTGIAYNVDLWKEALRILKPGGFLLSFGGTRTYHRMVCAIEDAGFEIRDQIMWVYGSGFPKSMDIAKAITKADMGVPQGGANPLSINHGKYKSGCSEENRLGRGFGAGAGNFMKEQGEKEILELTPNAQQWQGWGTALKPANEPIVVARKPLSEKTVADNVLKWGTGGINIDACRIPLQEHGEDKRLGGNGNWKTEKMAKNVYEGGYEGKSVTSSKLGRFPANVILDEEAGKLLDEQSGIKQTTRHMSYKRSGGEFIDGIPSQPEKDWFQQETGGASRFFYCAKASKKERGEGNNHPTVKPQSLMRYLCRLVTPPGGTVLEPFAGSGTTILAATEEGFNVMGIEKEPKYCNIIRERMNALQGRLAL